MPVGHVSHDIRFMASGVLGTYLNHVACRVEWDCNDEVIQADYRIGMLSGQKHNDSLEEMRNLLVTNSNNMDLEEEVKGDMR